MKRKNKDTQKKYGELERLLQEARQEVEYYKKIARETGRRRLREIDQLSRLISALKKAEDELKESERRYRSLFENSTAATMIIDEDTTVSMVNTQFEVLSGYSRDEVVGKMSWTNLVHPDDVERMIQYHRGRRDPERGAPKEYEFRFVRKDGEIRYIFIRADLFPGSKQSIASLMDITSRKLAEEALQREKEKFRILVEESPFGVCIIGDNGEYKYINPKFTEIFGYTLEDVPSGKEWFKKAFSDKEFRQEVIEMWVKDLKASVPGEMRPRIFSVRCKDGSEKTIQFRSVTLQTGDQFVIYEDITERKLREEQLLHAQKMEAIGTLAGGIAHDFNNLLMGIQGRTSLMLMDMSRSDPYFEELKKIEEIVKSAADLTKQLLGFARGGKYQSKVVNLNELIEKSFAMFGRTRKDIRIHEKYEEKLWHIDVDPVQIEQVLLNIYINAWQAMPNGGDLYIETQNVVLKEEFAESYNARPGEYVKVSVTDTGIGMDESTKRRIFEPFFTTKGRGKGIGLGLASAYGIIKNHSGIIDVASKKGMGTTFSVYLPATRKEFPGMDAPCTQITGGNETILLVDDEERVIDIAEKILKKMGYEVYAARSGEEAVSIYKAKANEIDLVILDVIMPGMNGAETYDQIKAIDSGAKVLLSSGYSVDGLVEEVLQRGCEGFIQKPFRAEELSSAIRQILSAVQ